MIDIIVPCFNEEEALPLFYPEFCKLAERMDYEEFTLLLVNDGSRDNTLAVMKELAEKDKRVKYISFSRNFGKEAANYAGLQHSRGDYAVIMDADLQHPPALVAEMYKAITEEGYDSAAARRVNRKGEPPVRSFFAHRFYALINRISKANMVDGGTDYRLMNRKFVDAILSMKEYNRFTKGLFGWVGFRTKWIEYENVERSAGESKWSFWSLLRYAIEGITAFSTAPLVLSVVIGVVLSLLAFLAVIFIIIRYLAFGDPVQGWTSTIVLLLFLSGMQMIFLGIIGEYLAKAYLEVKERPVYICGETNLTDEEDCQK